MAPLCFAGANILQKIKLQNKNTVPSIKIPSLFINLFFFMDLSVDNFPAFSTFALQLLKW
jgi:hypothetical protein